MITPTGTKESPTGTKESPSGTKESPTGKKHFIWDCPQLLLLLLLLRTLCELRTYE